MEGSTNPEGQLAANVPLRAEQTRWTGFLATARFAAGGQLGFSITLVKRGPAGGRKVRDVLTGQQYCLGLETPQKTRVTDESRVGPPGRESRFFEGNPLESKSQTQDKQSTIETILTDSATVWYASCTATERQDLHCVVKAAQRFVRMELPGLDTIYSSRLRRKAISITRDTTHPGHSLFDPLPFSKRFRTLKTRTNRLRNNFDPRAVASIVPLPQNNG
ncbi:uncharacterized protein LOC132396204 isoform X1 [Hypanus sabinus]|uniref:uncharacterized protein LOC132396204 isoform X1 n=1 Tax=Hypanus sabinus TaxID=79690 RepID=UPI0028C3FBC9|nr:uncharacterized protein LOC132396204 isoform X1 [Hypanus sabinus]